VKVADPFYSTPAWRSLRLVALRRAAYRCQHCGCDVSRPGQARVDHKLPRRQRPDLELSLGNLQVLCARCDNIKHADKGGTPRIRGTDQHGNPTDPRHHWNIAKPGGR
jgi:5-methylcytosine-specific restriction enzyme A